MSSFVSVAKVTPPTEPEDGGAQVISSPFWPVIMLSELRKAMKLDGQVTTDRLMSRTIEAVAHINDQLGGWEIRQQTLGYTTLADVPAMTVNHESSKVWRYRNAVYSLAKALLIEGYRDIDTTRDGEKHAMALSTQIDTLWRDVRFSINDIMNRHRQFAELV
ncbi:head completion/stabilization protein [Hafnia alvei]|uniref:head completion/stabilization protein n=1 Tax=Hafnia alvei TaxID=569 RepID=UPI000B743F40|nr:head completion/stabilization protein [Hafnia alvei]MBI0277277.1 head completion/stabilization protein [Hafnia alvei]PNK97565.1 capsid assembly protein [Hafnia alvei]